MNLSFEMLNPDREWGTVQRLAHEHGVSRKFLYELRDRAGNALLDALAPRQPGRQAAEHLLCVDAPFLRRATLVFASIFPGSIREIELALDLLFQESRSLGWIQQTLRAGGEAAEMYWQRQALPLEVLGEVDEIFQGRQPCLTVVDGRSFLALSLQAAEHRDETQWGCTLLDLEDRGGRFRDLSADGAQGIAKGIQAAEIRAPFYPDLFHQVREAHPVTQRLERAAYAALDLEARAERALREAHAGHKRRGPRLKISVPLEVARPQAAQAVYHYDAWCYLWQEARRALEPWDGAGRLRAPQETRALLETVCDLLEELHVPTLTKFIAEQLRPALEDLLAAPQALYEALAPWQALLPPDTLAFLLWAWSHRQALALTTPEALVPPDLLSAACAVWEILAWFHRTSCLAESLHSWLRPHFEAHRSIPVWLLPLLLLVWNHHTFTRGKRRGHTPMELAGLEGAPSLAELFELLVAPQAVAG
jgi:hypothetical protein